MGLPGINFAPADIAPAEFFGEWLSKQVEPLKPLLGVLGDQSATMSIRVTGDDGGEWSCTVNKDGLTIKEGLSEEAEVTVILSTPDFQRAVSGALPMAGSRAGRKRPSPEEAPGLIENALEQLRQVAGQLRYRIEDPAGDFMVDVKFAGPLKDDPDVEVIMSRETAEGIAGGSLNPQTAFMAGQVQIQGDISLLMQLMPLMGA